MRRFPIFAAVVVGAAVFVAAAPAGKPAREHVLFDDATFSGVCSFDVFRHVLVNHTILTTYSDGTQRYTGSFKERLTNLTTGKFIDFNGSGPVTLVYHADGTITETDLGPQFERPEGQLLLTTGPVVWQFDSSFNVLSFTLVGGTTKDVCAVLS